MATGDTLKLADRLEVEIQENGSVALSLEYENEPGQTGDYIVLTVEELERALEFARRNGK